MERPQPQRAVQRDVAARWTPMLSKKGWTPICDYFLDSYTRLAPKITNLEALLIIHLMRYKWDAEAPFPGFRALSKRMGITATSARNHARSLEKKGYLKREKRVGTTNKFDLTPLFAALERLLQLETVAPASPSPWGQSGAPYTDLLAAASALPPGQQQSAAPL
ncbi:MAG: helix-turn-helix domain-containing protein [Gemmataceae bacterium]|nr:helix-turn-helix domain-containing protein [Gemmataceae bacterium]